MGIPLYFFDNGIGTQNSSACNAQRNTRQRFPHCPEELKERVVHLFDDRSRNDGNGESHERQVRFEDDIAYRWKMDLNLRCEYNNLNLSELLSKRSKDGALWLFYSADGAHFMIYDSSTRSMTVVTGLHVILNERNGTISSLDCYKNDEESVYQTVLGLTNGDVRMVNCDNMGGIRDSHIIVLSEQRSTITDVFSGLLPEYCMAFSSKDGLLVTDMVGPKTTFKVRLDAEDTSAGMEFKALLSFPHLILFNHQEIWHYENVFQNVSTKIKYYLPPEERLLNVKPCFKNNLLLLETDQRYVSVHTSSTGNSYDDACTLFRKTDQNLLSTYQVSCIGQQVFVTEQHLYGTCLTMYKHSPIANQWLSLGYTDIRAKYNISKVLRLTVLSTDDRNDNNSENYLLSILAEDGTIQIFSILPY